MKTILTTEPTTVGRYLDQAVLDRQNDLLAHRAMVMAMNEELHQMGFSLDARTGEVTFDAKRVWR